MLKAKKIISVLSLFVVMSLFSSVLAHAYSTIAVEEALEVTTLNATPVCPNELLLQVSNKENTGRGVIDEERDLLLQRLNEAALRGELVYVANFYITFVGDGIIINDGVAPRNPFMFERLRGTAFLFNNGVGWQLMNVDQPMRTTRLDSAVAELLGDVGGGFINLISRDTLTGRNIAPGESVYLNTIGSRWNEGTLGVSENGRHFHIVRVRSPWPIW